MKNQEKKHNVFSDIYRENQTSQSNQHALESKKVEGSIIILSILSFVLIPVGVLLSFYFYHNNRKYLIFVMMPTIYSSLLISLVLYMVIFRL